MKAVALPLALAALWPQPREVGDLTVVHLRLPIRIVAPAHLMHQSDLLRRELTQLFGPKAVADSGSTTFRIELDPAGLPHEEEYALDPGASEVRLRAHDAQGAFWAVHTLIALLEQATRTPGGYDASIPTLRDWPDTPFRAFMIQGAWTQDLGEFRRNLDLLARLHVTYVAIEFGPQVVLNFDPSIARGGRFSKAQAREVVNYARSLGLKPIGYLNMLGHLDRAYQKPPYTQHGGIDLRSEATYQNFVYPILSEMLDVYGPVKYFHCGMDEAWELFTWLSKQGYDVTDLLAQHVKRVDDFLKARGVQMVMWHDMLIAPDLAKQLGGPVGPANGGPPQNTAAALSKIPKDVILDYWFYTPLAKYPALDYLKAQGFRLWASPWQTPFSLVRYAAARGVPSMGTLWSGPPGCFASPTFSPVTALYAQAAWHAAAAPDTVTPEPALRPAAQRATSVDLWGRHSLRFPGDEALLLSTKAPKRIAWPTAGAAPAAGVEQHYGVPLSTAHPDHLAPLAGEGKALADGADAASVLLPGGVKLGLDGVNTQRGEDQLILYCAPETSTGTNIYGVEVSVSARGKVLEVAGYGSSDHAVPAGGFVLSAHTGRTRAKSRRLEALRPGDRIAVLDAEGDWIGGYSPTQLLVELPGGKTVRADGEDTERGDGQLVVYRPGYDDGHTGTNQFGTEVVVRGGKVAEVRKGAGDTAIPDDGYVLSAHGSATTGKAAALDALKPGDEVRLVLEKGDLRTDLAAALAERRLVYAVGARCAALYLAMSADATSSPGTPLGEWVVDYADGSTARMPVRYGREVLGPTAHSLPQRTDDPVWLVEGPPLRFLVREWTNPHPDREIRDVAFEPEPALLDLGAKVLGATAAVAKG